MATLSEWAVTVKIGILSPEIFVDTIYYIVIFESVVNMIHQAGKAQPRGPKLRRRINKIASLYDHNTVSNISRRFKPIAIF